MMTLHVILELPVHVIFLRSLTIVYLSIGGVHCTAATADDDSLVGYIQAFMGWMDIDLFFHVRQLNEYE